MESEKIAMFENPFSKKEGEKITDIESQISANLESQNFDKIESEKYDDLKEKNNTITKLENI